MQLSLRYFSRPWKIQTILESPSFSISSKPKGFHVLVLMIHPGTEPVLQNQNRRTTRGTEYLHETSLERSALSSLNKVFQVGRTTSDISHNPPESDSPRQENPVYHISVRSSLFASSVAHAWSTQQLPPPLSDRRWS